MIRTILAGDMTIQKHIDAKILVKTGLIKKEEGKCTLNGKLLELIFKKVLT